MPWVTLMINNMIVIEINIRILRLVIPFLAISGVIMVMRAYLSSFPAMSIVMGWWWCVPIILFPRRFRRCLGRIWHLRAFSLGASQACKLRSLHILLWLSYAFVIDTKLFFLLVPRPYKEPHVFPYNWDLQFVSAQICLRLRKAKLKATSNQAQPRS